MAASVIAGHHAVLYVGGVSTAQAAAAMTDVVPATHLAFQVTDVEHRVFDPTSAITQNWSAGPTGTITVNRLLGTFTSTVSEVANLPVTMSGNYIPMGALLYARDFSFKVNRKIEDVTPFNTNAVVRKRVIRTISGTIGTFFDPSQVASFHAGAAVPEYFYGKLGTDTVFLLRASLGANLDLYAWVKPDREALNFVVEGVNKETVTFTGYPDADGNGMALQLTA